MNYESKQFDFHKPGYMFTVTITGNYPYTNEDLENIAKLYFECMMLDLV